MGIFSFFRGSKAAEPPQPRADLGAGFVGFNIDDPRILEFLRLGDESVTGRSVGVETALRNPAMFRAVSLISNSIGSMPMHLINEDTKEKAKDHALYRILHSRPNDFQSAFDFRTLMQLRALVKGNAYALIVRSREISTGKTKVIRLVPLDPDKVTPVLSADWTVTYRYDQGSAGTRIIPASEVFHLRGMSLDGLNGISLVKQARDAIAIALAAEMATGRMFKNGSLVGGALMHKGKLSDQSFERLQASLAEKEGAENAGKNLILEEGMEWKAYGQTARDAQTNELRKMQVEEIARITGVPRPLLMVDETSWGSGIQALGQFFVSYGLTPWFEAWQQAVQRSLLSDEDQDLYVARFNPAALLRASLTEQADYLAKALGAGGHSPWMYVDEVRDVVDLPRRDTPPNTMMGHNGGPALE